ncbi:MAG: SH3 domain-containing protein [Bacteroidales bacterium]|nr:SH3 domain-containing protein [Bacteroidales bacterium]
MINFRYLHTVVFLVLGFFSLYAQDQTERLNKLLQRRSELQRSISYYQKELREVELEISQLQSNDQPQIVSESNQKIVAEAGANGAILRQDPNINSQELAQIPANATIYVHHEYKGMYFKVTYYGQEGWVNYTQIATHPEVDALINTPKQNNTTTKVLTVDESDPKFQRLEKIYGKEDAVKLMNHQLWKGMSHGQARESIGKPVSQTRENTSKGLKEEWNYNDKKLIFLNGSLISW